MACMVFCVNSVKRNFSTTELTDGDWHGSFSVKAEKQTKVLFQEKVYFSGIDSISIHGADLYGSDNVKYSSPILDFIIFCVCEDNYYES